MFIEEVKKSLKTCQNKVFILCGDNDENKTGQKMNQNIEKDLKELGIESKILQINKKYNEGKKSILF
jgi:hypothetical protein